MERTTRFVDDLFVRGFERRCRCRGGEDLSDLGEEAGNDALNLRNMVRDCGRDRCDYVLVHTAIKAIPLVVQMPISGSSGPRCLVMYFEK